MIYMYKSTLFHLNIDSVVFVQFLSLCTSVQSPIDTDPRFVVVSVLTLFCQCLQISLTQSRAFLPHFYPVPFHYPSICVIYQTLSPVRSKRYPGKISLASGNTPVLFAL